MKQFLLVSTITLWAGMVGQGAEERLKVQVSWGHEAATAASYFIRPIAATDGLRIEGVQGMSLEAGEGPRDDAWQTRAGAGDVDGLGFTLVYESAPRKRLQGLHVIWADLIAASDPDTAMRWSRDAAMTPQSPKLTIQMNAEGTLGFSVTVDQLLAEKAIWVPDLNVYVTAGEAPVPFLDHRKALAARQGARLREQLRAGREASLEEYLEKWEDMGDPAYVNPQPRGPGHIVGITWDSAIPKFGIDRGAGVWNDYGNPDKFRFWFAFGDLEQGITRYWKSQRLLDGLPVITTVFERDGVRYEVEQFAYPLEGPPSERRGNLKMVLLQKVRLTELRGQARTVPVSMTHKRQLEPHFDSSFRLERSDKGIVFRDAGFTRALLSIEGRLGEPAWAGSEDYARQQKRLDVTVFQDLAANGESEFIVKLPSPILAAGEDDKLVALDYTRAREGTVKYWTDYLSRGAHFEAPEKAVNDLFRANLWHALRLPRRHGSGANVRIDLPYSNFAYGQTGTPWPVNQAVYVDYMIYDLRGYHDISAEELIAQYKNNQEGNGHVSGYANWGVYTPSMLYVVAKNFLLSGDRAAFDRLLPFSLKAMDWCLGELRTAQSASGAARGLVPAPLNDLTGEGIWAFNQAYFYAGLELFGRALETYGHPRSQEPRAAARELRSAVHRAFGAAAMQSPVVQLRDGRWVPYVPAEALKPRRLLDVWYPTDVDTGAAHMVRLQALDPQGHLADWLLDDHEDNLFYKGWGIANEPVYNQHATGYLLRDEAEAAIRVFYSYIASAFSHSALEPVEHRFTHGQYFGPPSTDGAWFDLYRHMLIREADDGALLLAQAAPRAWLGEGKRIVVRDAPTHYGPLSMTITSRTGAGQIEAEIQTPARSRPRAIVLRLRHPQKLPLRSVTVNGRNWTDFDSKSESIRISGASESRYSIVAGY